MIVQLGILDKLGNINIKFTAIEPMQIQMQKIVKRLSGPEKYWLFMRVIGVRSRGQNRAASNVCLELPKSLFKCFKH